MDYAGNFFTSLSPAFLGRVEHKRQLEEILERVKNQHNTQFINLLKEEIERMEEIMFVRARGA
jgi:hypothetical protein